MRNELSQFLGLLSPKQPVYIVQIVSVNESDGTSMALFPGGDIAPVKGVTVPVDGKARVIGGEIRGPAPDLDADTVDV